ncbi:MAG: P1 family peptidase [Acidimicrobiia bacterium]|nr:P1 family peptidase [Acidimicrobiia bacterium]
MKGLTDIDGILVGHATNLDARTGCTAILCPQGAVAGLDIRGSATAASELDLLTPGHLTEKIHAVTFTGGSAFGLEASSGVRLFLERKGFGFQTGPGILVPLVPCAVIYDLSFANAGLRPTREMGHAAATAASSAAVEEGAVGAGAGATVGKLYGLERAMKSGVGSATIWLDGPYAGVRVAALAVVNAFGDVRDPQSGQLIAGARHSPNSTDLIDTALQLKRGARGGFPRTNTTLVAVATNAQLNKTSATKLAQHASAGMAQALSPAWTIHDGDLTIALSCGEAKADITALGTAAAEATAQAILRAVRSAPSMGGLPGLRS